eukprot:Transcript_4862.p1 GENE.Transcript_4862~~Transcript_4862.p1  ORF type:complete len:335 (-),score=61.77 Transcript_4862:87-1010(-)
MEFAEIRLPRPSLSRPGSQARMGRSVSFSNEEQVYPQRQPTAQPTPPESPEMLRRPRTTPPDTPETSFKGGTAGLPPQTSPLAMYSATAAELGAIVGGPSRSLQQLQRLVSFQVEAETRWGDTVVLVGSTPQLGSWVPDAGLPLQTDERTYPAWRLPPISLKEGVEYEFKFVILRAGPEGQPAQAEWEPLPENRKLQMGAEAPAEFRMATKWGEGRTLVWTRSPPPPPPPPPVVDETPSTSHVVPPRMAFDPSPARAPSLSAVSSCASSICDSERERRPDLIRPASGRSIASAFDLEDSLLSPPSSP